MMRYGALRQTAGRVLRIIPAGVVMWMAVETAANLVAVNQNPVQRRISTSPGPQWGHHLVYHERLGRIVLVEGGALWTWDGRRWELQADQAGVPQRRLGGAAYDASRELLIVFGGRAGPDGVTNGDTWIWDRTSWREVQTGSEAGDTIVGIRNHHAMAYDESRGRTVMYGGTIPPPDVSAQEQLKRRDSWRWPTDTWEFDGSQWRRGAVVGPGPRSGPTLEYDARRQHVVLFGGVGPDGAYSGGTWAWNGTAWNEVASVGPAPRASHQMVYDSNAGVMWLYGGGNQSGRLQDMWRWDGSRWTEVAMTGATPGPRNGHAMAFDRSRHRLVLHGGFGSGPAPLGDTWEWDGARWAEFK
jgi:hypothetical protein